MGRRLDLSKILKSTLGSSNVYFQPPESLKMSYPCIVYDWDKSDTRFANDSLYLGQRRYQIKIIDRDPDSVIPDKIAKLPKCSFDRHYVADNLHHFIYNLYY